MIKVGDLVFIRETGKSLYKFLDTNTDLLSFGVVIKEDDKKYIVKMEKEIMFFGKDDKEISLFSVDEYIKRCVDISFNLSLNAEKEKKIKEEYFK